MFVCTTSIIVSVSMIHIYVYTFHGKFLETRTLHGNAKLPEIIIWIAAPGLGARLYMRAGWECSVPRSTS